LVEIVRALDERPRMWLVEERYGAVVSLVLGFQAGSGSSELDGFQDWVAAELLGEPSSVHWSSIVAAQQNLLVEQAGPSALSQEESDRASKELIGLLLRFLVPGDSVVP